MTPIIQFRQVNYRYGHHRYALNGVTFDIAANRRTAIVGANGAGKSTLVFHMNGLFLPLTGTVLFKGEPVTKANRERMIEHVGIVFQDPDDQIISMTVRDDVAFGPTQRGLPPEEVERRTEAYLSLLNIKHLADRNPNELSYGQKKMVAIAGILAMETEVIIFDEPMAFLDPEGKKEIQRILNMLHEQGKTVIVTTHDMQLVAEWADDVIVMNEGACLGKRSPARLFADPDLLHAAKLHLPPIAELVSPFWDGDPEHMPLRLEEAKRWLQSKLR